MTGGKDTYLQVDAAKPRSVFHGAAASLMMKCRSRRDELPTVYEEIWEGTDAHASWLEVPAVEASFVCVWGPRTPELVDWFKTLLDARLAEDLIAEAPGLPHDELLQRFYWVAYMTEHANERVLQFFDSGMTDPRENIRLSALNAYHIRLWPEWRMRVEAAATSDASEKVRAQAQALLDKR